MQREECTIAKACKHVCAEALSRHKAAAMASILIKSSFLTLDFDRYPVKIGNFPQQPFLLNNLPLSVPQTALHSLLSKLPTISPTNRRSASASSQRSGRSSLRVMATGIVQEVLPPPLDSTSEPPAIFDGTTRLYISYICPYAQRTWIARNYKGLQDKLELVPIDLQNRPAWYKEKVYPENKVPSLEHNNQVKGESLDLLKYIDSSFEGPSLLPDDPAKQKFAEELISYCDSFNTTITKSFQADGVPEEVGATFDRLESALSKFDDGPFFLGQFSMVDIAYAPFIERFQYAFLELRKYDITAGRPNLTKWLQELNKIDAYNQTIQDPQVLLDIFKRRFLSK